MTPFGDQLRAERERRGQALEQVSETTKVSKAYLEALEGHDWKALPADVFTRGYVRTYAEYLGLDQEHLLKVYARERRIAGVDGPPTSERAQDDAAKAILKKLAETHGVKTRRGGTKWVVMGLSGTGIAALAAWIFLNPVGLGWRESTAEAPSYVANAVNPPDKSPADLSGVAPATPLPAPPAEPPRQAEPSTVIEAPPVAAPPRTDATSGDNKSPTDLSAVAPTATPLPAPPAKPPSQAEPSIESHLKVEDFGVGRDVVDHRLVGRADRFREGTVVWFWTSVAGGRPGDTIRHVWLHDGRSVAEAELHVNGARWRTQSRRPLPQGSTGDWTVEARDPEGHVIASVAFTCVAAD